MPGALSTGGAICPTGWPRGDQTAYLGPRVYRWEKHHALQAAVGDRCALAHEAEHGYLGGRLGVGKTMSLAGVGGAGAAAQAPTEPSSRSDRPARTQTAKNTGRYTGAHK